jgi:ABC-type branched-subunit amino acid transport system substrate-binding protein
MSVSRRTAAFVAAGVVISLTSAGSALAAPTPKPAATKAKPVVCAAEPGVTANSVTVGVIFPKSGPAATTWTGFDQAALLRFSQENAKGGVNGRKIIVNVYDDQASPSTQTTVANKAIDQDGVFGIVNSSTASSMYETLKVKNIPVTGMPYVPGYATDRNVFGVTGAFAGSFGNNLGILKAQQAGVTKLGHFNHNSAGANAGTNATLAAAKLMGMPIPIVVRDLPSTSYDATATALQIKNSGVDGIIIAGTADTNISVMKALKQQGVTGLKYIGTSGILDPKVVASLGNVLDGVTGSTYGTVPVGVPNKPAVRTFANGMIATGGNPYGAMAGGGFASADLMVRGLKAAGVCPTRASFVDNLRKVTNFDGAGLIPAPISFLPGLTPDGDPAKCSWYVGFKNGVVVPDAKATCGRLLNVATGEWVSN